ncbi:MAG: hypothetical protein JXR96_26110 [Deltaproteobacteria bacterium]|nr:hypothetical protein [Deltaproteobacteria bacterium]
MKGSILLWGLLAVEVSQCVLGCGGSCKKHDHLDCMDGNLVWIDSCGQAGEVFEVCTCGCDDSQTCRSQSWECSGDSIEICDDGVYNTESCEDLCAGGGKCYSGLCGHSDEKGHDVCFCEDCPNLVNMTLRITDACPDGMIMHYRYFDMDNNLVWPDNEHVYTTPEYDTVYSEELTCYEGAKICYGARVFDGSSYTNNYWGVDIDRSKSCDSCCYYCASGETHGWRLTCE